MTHWFSFHSINFFSQDSSLSPRRKLELGQTDPNIISWCAWRGHKICLVLIELNLLPFQRRDVNLFFFFFFFYFSSPHSSPYYLHPLYSLQTALLCQEENIFQFIWIFTVPCIVAYFILRSLVLDAFAGKKVALRVFDNIMTRVSFSPHFLFILFPFLTAGCCCPEWLSICWKILERTHTYILF